MRPSDYVRHRDSVFALRRNRFLAQALALASVLLALGCDGAGGLLDKSNSDSISGTWSGTLTAAFMDNTSASFNIDAAGYSRLTQSIEGDNWANFVFSLSRLP